MRNFATKFLAIFVHAAQVCHVAHVAAKIARIIFCVKPFLTGINSTAQVQSQNAIFHDCFSTGKKSNEVNSLISTMIWNLEALCLHASSNPSLASISLLY